MSINAGRIVSGNQKGRKLTPKMVEFVDLYMEHKNGTQAVVLSSYKTKNPALMAAELLNHPLVVDEIKRRQAARTEKSEVKAEWLIEKLAAIVQRTEEDNPNAAIRALELLGKSIALWKERNEISGPDGEAIRHEQTVKENASDFTSRISSLAKRAGTTNVVELPVRGRASSS